MTNRTNILMISAWHEQGGNVFQRHLDGHPELCVYPFESQISTPLSKNILAGPNHVIPQRYSYPEFSTETTSPQAYSNFWDQELKTFLRTPSISKFKDCGMIIDESIRKQHFFDICNRPPFYSTKRGRYISALLESTYYAWENYYDKVTPKKYFVGYSPPICLDADKFFEDFPDGKMIHIVRNPLFGYADTKKRPFPFSIENYCRIWNFVQTEAAIYQKKYFGRFHVVYYNQLCKTKKKVMSDISRKLGIQFDLSLMYPSFNGKLLETVKPWGTIEKVSTAYEKELIKTLSEKERTMIAMYCSDNRFFSQTIL